MIVIIAGGRDWKPEEHCFAVSNVRRLLRELVVTEVVEGEASGADQFGKEIARKMGIPVKKFKANWARYGKRAGSMRNIEMADYSDAVILLKGGVGTASMKMIALQLGLKILYEEK